VEVGNDGRVLISMLGSGVVSGVPQNTLAVYDRNLAAGLQLLPVSVPALPTTPAPLPAQNLPRPTKIFTGSLLRTPDGQFIVGVITPTNASTYIFVYEVASGVVLRNRTVSGSSTVLSIAPDGSRFMAGMTMYDTATLGVIAQQNNANAPFTFAGAFNTLQNVGGSVFSGDGTTLYSAFNTAANSNPTPPPLASTLLINDPRNLGIRLGIRLPESIVAKMVLLSDGSEAWGLSDSGIINLPLGRLYEYPILAPETTQIFLSQDDCSRGISSGALRINNLGKGRLTYSVATNTSSAVVYKQSSGLAPSTLTFTMEPGRSGVVRQPGDQYLDGRRHVAGNTVRDHAGVAGGDQHSAGDSRVHEFPPAGPAGRRLSGAHCSEQQTPIARAAIPRAMRACRTCCSTKCAASSTSPMRATTASKSSTWRSSTLWIRSRWASCQP
jgi:hypothetical protein